VTEDGAGTGPEGTHFAPVQLIAASGCIRFFLSQPDRAEFRPALFLDRDGVINERIPGGYVTNWDAFRFVPGIVEALQALSSLELPIIVVSNQAAVGKGLLSIRGLSEITRRFADVLRRAEARVDAVYYCPHTPSENCDCRKPKPGLLRMAASDWGIDLRRSVLIGDAPTDFAAAAAAGCRSLAFSIEPRGPVPASSDAMPLDNSSGIFSAVAALLAAPPKDTGGHPG
jgi:D-glycero-D-manno-heptose 1,7-bisphosphate phosphatase